MSTERHRGHGVSGIQTTGTFDTTTKSKQQRETSTSPLDRAKRSAMKESLQVWIRGKADPTFSSMAEVLPLRPHRPPTHPHPGLQSWWQWRPHSPGPETQVPRLSPGVRQQTEEHSLAVSTFVDLAVHQSKQRRAMVNQPHPCVTRREYRGCTEEGETSNNTWPRHCWLKARLWSGGETTRQMVPICCWAQAPLTGGWVRLNLRPCAYRLP